MRGSIGDIAWSELWTLPAIMFLTGRSPFGRSWLDAVATATPVVPAMLGEGGDGQQLAVPPLDLPLRRWLWPIEANIQGRRIARTVRSTGVRARLVHSHFYGASSAMPAATARLDVPFVLTEHSSWLSGANPDPAKRLSEPGRRIARRVFSAADHVIAVSDYLAEDIAALGVEADKITVIGNPVDTARFHPAARRVDDGQTTIASIGRLADEKGFDVLLAALARVGASRPWRLELIGTGPARPKLASLAQTLRIQDRVTFRGQLSRDATLRTLQSADLYCSASRIETFGIAVAEAIACGLPTVTTAAGALREFAEAPAVTQTPVDDVQQLAEALRAWIDGELQRAPDAQWRWVDERFSPRVVGARTARLYSAIA